MKKTTLLFVATFLLSVSIATAQSIADAVKNISYDKRKSAIETMQKLYNANKTDAQNVYWLGQAYLANDEIGNAKAVYQKALQDGVNDPYLWVGMAHVEIREGGDINAAKQKFEQAITATLEAKGKNKGKPNVGVLAAIGRANADGSSKEGDATYAIEKLKQAGDLDKLNSDVFVSMGILYQKLGGEMGGEAVKAYQEAINRNPKNAEAFWHIGKIYATQNNKESMEDNYGKSIAVDASYPPTYLSWFQYYQNRDVNRAKEYLDKYIQLADKDCKTDYYYADYLFRAGKYQESLDKAIAMENGDCKKYMMLPILYAYNYDRLGDSTQAKANLEKFFANATLDKVEPAHYELAVKVYSKFPGTENTVVSYLQKAIDADTTKANKLNYMKQAAELYGKAKMYTEQLNWLKKYYDYKGGILAEFDHYSLTNAAYMAKDYAGTMSYAQNYISAFPDKPQGYTLNVRAAKALDTTTQPGIAEKALLQQNDFFAKDTAKNKKAIVANYYYLMIYYADKVKDYAKALEYCDKILMLIPADAEMTNIRKQLQSRLDNKNKPAPPPAPQPPPAKPTKPATGTNAKPTTKPTKPVKK